MKKSLGLWISLMLIVSACNQKENISLTGNYTEGPGEYLILEMLNISETRLIDSIKVSSTGKFKTRINLDNPELVILKNKNGEIINLLPSPHEDLQINIAGKSFKEGYEVLGSEESEKVRQLVEQMAQTKYQLDSLSVLYDELENQDSPEAEVLVSTYRQFVQKQKRSNIRFIVENINSLSSVYALYQRITPENYLLNEVKDLQYFKIVADSVKVRYPSSTLVKSLVQDVERRIKEYNNALAINELASKNIIEEGFINLKIQNQKGDTVSLASLRGNVILLNFWASWDNTSIENNKQLKTIYKKYNQKGFEVYSVGMENNKNNWISAIHFEEYPWINVSELSYPYSYAANAYNIQSLPSNYLIDRQGNIVAKDIFGSNLATWLDNLL